MFSEAKMRRFRIVLWYVILPAIVALMIYPLTRLGKPFAELKQDRIFLGLAAVAVGAFVLRSIPMMFQLLNVTVQHLIVELTRVLASLHRLSVEMRGLKKAVVGDVGKAGVVVGDEEVAAGTTTPERHARERLAVGVMTRAFERSLTTSSVALLVSLLLLGGYAAVTRDRGVTMLASVIAIFFLLGVFRQALLRWRVQNGSFGSSEHEVRELLAFAMRHPEPDDFFDDNGNLLPAFDLRPESAEAVAPLSQVVPGAAV